VTNYPIEDINMKKNPNAISVGLAFLQAAVGAIPKTMGDRERINLLDGAMSLAVRGRFAFDRDDAAELQRFDIHTCVGVFRTLDWYLLACQAGGTYPRMWEAHHKQRPWVAARAAFVDRTSYGPRPEFKEDNRVAPGAALLMPPSFGNPCHALASHEGLQVWWCTSMTDETVTLCRYLVPATLDQRLSTYGGFERSGSPARVRKLTREEWTTWNAEVKAGVALAA